MDASRCASSSISPRREMFDLRAEPAFELLGRGAEREIGLRADQIDDGFGLGQVDLPLRKARSVNSPGRAARAPARKTSFQTRAVTSMPP